MNETLAIMRDVHIGLRDVGRPVLWFTTYITEGTAALQVLPWDRAAEVIQAAGVYDITKLEGHACWVEQDGGRINFLRPWGPK